MTHAATRIQLDPYYPLVRGYEWIYADQATGEPLIYGIGDLHLTPRGGVVSFRTTDHEEQFLVSRKNLYSTTDPAHPILRFPLRDGAQWAYDDADWGEIRCEVLGPEEIDTPAGRLRDCYRVEYRAQGEVILCEWYAWEIGLAKWIERHGDRPRCFALCALICL